VRLGLVPWRSGRLGALLVAPASPRATVFFAHGFLSHSGEFQAVLARLARAGFCVLAFDLPGHGFSDGELGAIADFELYGAAVADLTRVMEAGAGGGALLPRPWHAAGHSTGAAALFIYLQQFGNEARLDRLVLLSPLLRPAHWDLSLAGLALSGWFMRYVPHPAGEELPLGISGFPLSWVERLRDWNAAAELYGSLDRPALILQGGADDVVDFRHNLPYFQSRLPRSRTLMIEGAGHHLQTDQAFQKTFAEQVPSFLRGY
jgi:alpha-beta hydrolase superfamily lysophospholipase